MLEFTLEGEIGWDIGTWEVKNVLREAKGDDILINWASQGGLVSTGFKIFNLLKRYQGVVDFHIIGMAASMGSYIPMVANRITAEPNSVFMIHNAWNYTSGDHNEMRKVADILEGFSRLIGEEYVNRIGSSAAEVAGMMDKETWLFGRDIVAAGFIDEIIGSESESDDGKAHIDVAKEAVQACYAKVKKKADDYQAAAAYLIESKVVVPNVPPINITTPNDGEAEEESTMDLTELKAKFPQLYAEIVKIGVAEERDRVSAHLTLSNASGDLETAHKAIEDGTGMTAAIQAKHMAASMNNHDMRNRTDDNPGEVVPGGKDVADEGAEIVAGLIEKKFGAGVTK